MAASHFDDIIDSLKRLQQEIPDSLSLKDIKQDIGNTIRNINSPLLIMVMGEFSTGKSTFINAIVGQDVAKVDAKPTTAVITKLVYGASDQITVVFRDGSRKAYDADSFAKLTAEADDEANELHEKMDYVERAMPIEILKSMSIIDSPGLNSIKAVHEETTRRFTDNADTVIWLFDAEQPGSQKEIDALKCLNPRLSPLVLVNKIDTIDEDEGDSVEQILTNLERILHNNKLEAQRIIGVSAKKAVQGQKKNDEKLVEASRIADFYTAIEEVVLPRREEYKRNSLLDGLARIVFRVGSVVSEESAKAEALRDTDYTKCMEIQMALAATNDELENVATGFVDELEYQKSTLLGARKKLKLNAAEKAFFGVLYWLGLCVEKDEKTAQQYMEEAAVRNDATAQMNLAEIYRKLGQKDKAKYWFDRLGGQDQNEKHGKEAYLTGAKYYESENYSEAIKYYRKAANEGNANAMYALGAMYDNGEGIEKDEDVAGKWYRKALIAYIEAATHGNDDAMYKICDMYQNAEGVEEKEYESDEWFKKITSAYKSTTQNENAEVIYRIGEIYELELEDEDDAKKWYRKALNIYKEDAKHGNADAMFSIGLIYDYGDVGITEDDNEALQWYRKAAEAGHEEAQKRITVKIKEMEDKEKRKNGTSSLIDSLAEYRKFVESSPSSSPASYNTPFRIVVIGEYSRGKTTFINALLGHKLLLASKRPTTVIITKVIYGEEFSVRLYYADGKSKEISQEVFYQIKYTEEEDEVIAQRLKKELDAISYAEITYPSAFLQDNNLEIINTPGTDGFIMKRFVTNSLQKADAVIVLLSALTPLTCTEQDFLTDHIISNNIKNMFFVLNKKDILDDEEDDEQNVIDFTEKKLREILPPDISLRNRIFLASSEAALHLRRKEQGEKIGGRLRSGMPKSIEETGLPEIEKALSMCAQEHNTTLRKPAETKIVIPTRSKVPQKTYRNR